MPLIRPDTAALALSPRQLEPRHLMIDFGTDPCGWRECETGIRNLDEVTADFIDSAKPFPMNALLLPPFRN